MPLQVANAGDVGIAGDLTFNNPVAAYITGETPLYIRTSHPANSIDLTLSAANNGVVIVDDALEIYGTTTIALAQTSVSAVKITDHWGSTIFNLNNKTTSTLRTFDIGTNNGSVATKTGVQIGYGGLCVDNDGTCNASSTGKISARAFSTAGSDVAEFYPSLEPLVFGDLVMADPNNPGYIIKTTGEYNNNVIGVISQTPGIVMGGDIDGLEPDSLYPVALVGRIPTKVTSLNGAVKPGDLLTVAPTPGYAMKLQEGDTSKIIGTSLEPFTASATSTEGFVSMFINPDYKSTLGQDTFGLITDGQIATNAAISDLKIATIQTPGKIALSALPVEIALLQGQTQTFKGNYIFGANADSADLVVFNSKFGSDIKFAVDGLYNIGSASQTAAAIYVKDAYASKIVVAKDAAGWQDANIDDYGLYLAASSGSAYFGDNVVIGPEVGLADGSSTSGLTVALPMYPDFVLNGGDLLVKDDLGIGGDLYVVGNVRVAGAVEFAREGIAQMFNIEKEVMDNGTLRFAQGGDVVVVSASGTSQGMISNQPNSLAILGVVATSSGAVFGRDDGVEAIHELPLPVVVSGVANVNVSAENGPIHKGDKLTTAQTAGYAMLATRPGSGVLGMTLDDLAEGEGRIKVLVDLGTYYQPTAKIITVGESGADFKSIAKALASISDNSIQNRYLIKVAPGIYEETLTLKDYVDVVGEGEGLVTIQSNESPVVNGSANARLEGVTVKSTSIASEPVLLAIAAASPVVNNVSFEAASASPSTGISITGSPAKVSLNRLTFDSNYAQAITNLASTTVSVMHADLSQINGTALVAQNGIIKSYYNKYNGVFGDLYIAETAQVESAGDQYRQVTNLGVFLDATNRGKIEESYIDYGWLVESDISSGLKVKVSAGEGYINGVMVNTAAVSGLEMAASSTNYIFMTDGGKVVATTTPLSPPYQGEEERGGQAILIATVQTDLSGITDISNERANEIIVAKVGGKFRTISDALGSITTASENNRWTIKVGPGVYNEQVVLKPYVDIIGEGERTVVMNVNQPVVIANGGTDEFIISGQNGNYATTTGADKFIVGDVKISNLKLSLNGDTIGQPVVSVSSTNLTLEDVSINWSGDKGILGTAVEIGGSSKISAKRLNAFGMAYGLVQNVLSDGSATTTPEAGLSAASGHSVDISYSNISSTIADIKTVSTGGEELILAEEVGAPIISEETDNKFVGFGQPANIISSYNTLLGSGANFDIAKNTVISSAHDTYLRYTGEGTFRQNDYFRNQTDGAGILFSIQNAGLNLFNVNASGTIAINPQNTTGDSVVINSATASSTLTVINSGLGTALTVMGNMILTSATSGLPVVLSSAGAELNVGAPGDTINLNIEGVTYNFKENVRRNTLSAYLPAPQSGDKIWGDGNNSWRPPENITILGVKVQYACADSGFLQMVLKDKNGSTIANLDSWSCGGYDKIEVNDLNYHLTPDDGMYVDVATAVEGVTNVTVTVEFVYDNR